MYLRTEYQEGKKSKVISKHHIFIEKRYPVKYTKKSYVFILKKIKGDLATIESERYDVDEKTGNKVMEGGGYGTYKVGSKFQFLDRSPSGEVLFSLKVFLERVVETPL